VLLQQLDDSDAAVRHHETARSVLEVASVRRDEAGVYTCTASNDAGNASAHVSVVVECKYDT